MLCLVEDLESACTLKRVCEVSCDTPGGHWAIRCSSVVRGLTLRISCICLEPTLSAWTMKALSKSSM